MHANASFLYILPRPGIGTTYATRRTNSSLPTRIAIHLLTVAHVDAYAILLCKNDINNNNKIANNR